MATIIPAVNTVGVWKVKLPYTVKAGLPYWLIATRMFEDVTKAGVDVYKTYYEPFIKNGDQIPGTSDTFSFDKEVASGARILTLKSEAGDILYIPSTFIADYPDTDIVLYRPMIVSLNLGLFNEDVDFSILAQALQETCLAYAGVGNVQVAVHAAPATEGLNTSQVSSLETARQNAMGSTETNIAKIVRLEAELAQVRDTNAKLTTVVKNAGLLN